MLFRKTKKKIEKKLKRHFRGYIDKILAKEFDVFKNSVADSIAPVIDEIRKINAEYVKDNQCQYCDDANVAESHLTFQEIQEFKVSVDKLRYDDDFVNRYPALANILLKMSKDFS